MSRSVGAEADLTMIALDQEGGPSTARAILMGVGAAAFFGILAIAVAAAWHD